MRPTTTDAAKAAVVNRFLDALNTGDLDAVVGLLAPDFVAHWLWYEPLPSVGDAAAAAAPPPRELVGRTFAAWRAVMPDLRFTVEAQLVAGDRVITRSMMTATHQTRQTPVAVEWVSIDRVADGRIAETWFTWDRLGFWQQLGVVPPMAELDARAAA
jgi:ketosteroid isomerase-like protein